MDDIVYAHDSDSDFDEPYDSKTYIRFINPMKSYDSKTSHSHNQHRPKLNNVSEARIEAPMATLSIPHNPDETQSGEGRWKWNAKKLHGCFKGLQTL